MLIEASLRSCSLCFCRLSQLWFQLSSQLLALLFRWLAMLMFATAAMAVEEPEGYRLEMYDAGVPDTLAGATRVNAVQVRQLQLNDKALIVDVIPEHRKPDDMPAGQVWFPVPHMGIPGALWLPDVGYGVLSATTEAYLTEHLLLATHGNTDHAIVFYCRIDCWMSWNAAKRALSYGYSQVYWFADGLEDWQFEDYALEQLTPASGLRQGEVNEQE